MGASGGRRGGGSNPYQQDQSMYDQTQKDIGVFRDAIPGANQYLQGQQEKLGGLNEQLGGLAGPGWDNFTQSQMGQFDVLGNQRKQDTLSQLSRQGLTGTASANALGQQQWQTDAARQALSGQLGQQGLQFKQGVYGQQAGLLGQQADLNQTQVQNLMAPATLDIGQTAAMNAGKGGGGGGGGLFGKK